jgi:hypothetical protein
MTSNQNDKRYIDIELTDWEVKHCVDVANARMAVSNARGLNNASTYERTYLERIRQEVLGACGEMAVCKATGRFWSPSVDTFHRVPDIHPDIEVRATHYLNGCLPVRNNDPDDRWYTLVVGEPPKLRVVGSIRGHQAKRQEWLSNPHGHRPVYLVPQSALITKGESLDDLAP